MGLLLGLQSLAIGTLIGVAVLSFFPFGSGNLIILIFTMILPAVFLRVTFGYPLYGCIFSLQVPECVGYEVADVFQALNTSCIEWPPGVVISPANASCPTGVERKIVDCREEGFQDGADALVFLLEWLFPTFMAAFRSSPIGVFLASFPLWGIPLANFQFGIAGPSSVQEYCFYRTGLYIGLGQIATFLALFALGAIIIFLVVMNLLANITLFIVASAALSNDQEADIQDQIADAQIKQE
jgi:hypothetical protein